MKIRRKTFASKLKKEKLTHGMRNFQLKSYFFSSEEMFET
jgi:hypothetical protein